MAHKIFFLCSILFFKLRGLEHKISKLAIKEFKKGLEMLNKSHALCRYKANSGKNKKKC